MKKTNRVLAKIKLITFLLKKYHLDFKEFSSREGYPPAPFPPPPPSAKNPVKLNE